MISHRAKFQHFTYDFRDCLMPITLNIDWFISYANSTPRKIHCNSQKIKQLTTYKFKRSEKLDKSLFQLLRKLVGTLRHIVWIITKIWKFQVRDFLRRFNCFIKFVYSCGKIFKHMVIFYIQQLLLCILSVSQWRGSLNFNT